MHQPMPIPMRAPRRRLSLLTRLPSVFAALLLAAGAQAQAQAQAQAASARDADAVYRQDRAACLDSRQTADRSTCLKEAGAARAEARRQTLDNGESPAQLRANALLRCARVLVADRPECERLALGEGTRSGSVTEGAVVKQITTPASAPR